MVRYACVRYACEGQDAMGESRRPAPQPAEPGQQPRAQPSVLPRCAENAANTSPPADAPPPGSSVAVSDSTPAVLMPVVEVVIRPAIWRRPILAGEVGSITTSSSRNLWGGGGGGLSAQAQGKWPSQCFCRSCTGMETSWKN
jgi:hypothetical protein